ncbi:hypothetical protein PoB_000542100 [Plakobranchus ocellatus]|uniref:Uncharacterized protein n=1 Tax=Plakobranchus ocellatus TaxID=259542 RepID=A0AAV3Y6R8_9GAST|nr:hypothetical protein PoB_000542100 [Plakobranchus ocellatus]
MNLHISQAFENCARHAQSILRQKLRSSGSNSLGFPFVLLCALKLPNYKGMVFREGGKEKVGQAFSGFQEGGMEKVGQLGSAREYLITQGSPQALAQLNYSLLVRANWGGFRGITVLLTISSLDRKPVGKLRDITTEAKGQ